MGTTGVEDENIQFPTRSELTTGVNGSSSLVSAAGSERALSPFEAEVQRGRSARILYPDALV